MISYRLGYVTRNKRHKERVQLGSETIETNVSLKQRIVATQYDNQKGINIKN